ncbi:hypothetical protein LOZ57_000036 [Ophidiomyces ophidiicola]|uniref:uncharacterized protein n=1 Tax=Ophidiomyces ophidiicola TaxID=1387563 RepID=UPI0020C5812E|nr:uncharacterized protein LOZ57_000036 [Ophidiomyces ophidiicola]KAI1953695.1 hypothetical protein LOZ57_000036 [Ophidiomyces ophidiicola]KAI2062920.1 hypothetical protein LOZ43_000339 [Ophidiomyces ophidiicola]
MASQGAIIEETIVGLKRALAREQLDQDAYDDLITQPTNRGNKTRYNSKYVHAGSLGVMNGRNFYRKKVEHAGYTRHILRHNPPRYDSEGDELDEEDSDTAADADAAEENPYSGITLEALLAPLRHPSELPDHPSLAVPYTSKAIAHMVDLIDQRLRQEQHALWQAKKLHQQLLGDAPWIPCGAVEKPQDRAIFEPLFLLPKDLQQQLVSGDANHIAASTRRLSVTRRSPHEQRIHDATVPNGHNLQLQNGHSSSAAEDIEMEDATEDSKAPDTHRDGVPLETNVTQADAENERQQIQTEPVGDGSSSTREDGTGDSPSGGDVEGGKDEVILPQNTKTEDQDENMLDSEIPENEGSPEPPRRMTTRAQTNQVTGSQNTSRPASPAVSSENADLGDADSDNLTPHALYHFPSIRIDRNCGLPPMEADETRHLLWAYIQKQGETVRLFSEILEMLRKAHRLKENVFEWCKADGHVGEMSDGEDWYDLDKWGLRDGEDLKKGADEEEPEVDEGRATGKRGRRRA